MLPALLALTTAFVVVLVVCLWVLYAVRCRVVSRAAALRQRPAPAKPFVIATGLAHAATFGLTVWLMVMFAISMLWAGGGLIASKATMDGSTTLAVVDETLPRLIKTAMGIDPAKQVRRGAAWQRRAGGRGSCSEARRRARAERPVLQPAVRAARLCAHWGRQAGGRSAPRVCARVLNAAPPAPRPPPACSPPPACYQQGYLVHVGDRDVDIGTSSCSLFCFTLARAMLADNIDCKCDASLAATMMPPGNETHYISRHTCSQTPVMCAINARAFSLYRSHMVPAVGAIVLAMLCVLCLLCLLSGTYARALSELRRADISRCSSTDADMAVTDVDGGSPRKGSGVV